MPLAAAAGHLVAAAFGEGELAVDPVFALLTALASILLFIASYGLYGWTGRLAGGKGRGGRIDRKVSPILWMPVIISALVIAAYLLNRS